MVHQLAKRGKLGLSSGTASHLVERDRVSEKSGKTIHEIKQWPLGFDATLTPTPAEPRVGKVRPVSEEDHKSIKKVAEDILGFASKSGPSNVSVLGAEFKNHFGRKATEEEIEERYQEFQDMVNMSASEIEEWGEKECSNKASQNPDKVRSRVVSLLRTNKEDWGDEEYDDAGQVISFISRMKGVDGGDKPSEDCPTKRNISLMNWGFNPTKSIMADLDEIKSKFDSLSAKVQHDYSVGDLVEWDSANGPAQGRVVETVGEDETVSPSSTDREFSGNEDEGGYLIELVDYDEEEDEIVGRDETVFHLEGTLSSISESDVKDYTEQAEGDILEDIERGIEDISRKLQRI
jgi:gas vesicle protein